MIFVQWISLQNIYMAAHCCSNLVHAVTNRTLPWIFISVLFVTGVYHKMDDFNFEVINYPFPQSNIHSMLGYTTCYSQLIRLLTLYNNINDFLLQAKLSYSKTVKCGYIRSLLFKYFKGFCLAYKLKEKIGEKDYKLLFSRMIKCSPLFPVI